MLTINPKEVEIARNYGIMAGSVGPRPIAFASTINEEGQANLAPFSFFNVVSANPPMLMFSPLLRISDGSAKDTLNNVRTQGEVVINIVNYEMVQQMSLASTDYATGVNEFVKTGLTPLESDVVKPFRVKESPVQFECVVKEVVSLGEEGGAGNVVLCEVVRMHVAEEVMDEHLNIIDQTKIDQVARMGSNYYSRANQGMFEIPKPKTTMGIGVDAFPEDIRSSKVLTGNDLGKLGTIERLPNKEEINSFLNELNLVEYIKEGSVEKIHAVAQEYLKQEEIEKAWKVLLAKLN